MMTAVGQVSATPRALNAAEQATLVNVRVCSRAIAEIALLEATKQQSSRRSDELTALVERSLGAHRAIVYREAARIARSSAGGELGRVLSDSLLEKAREAGE